jgi:glutamine amidotransferase
MNIGIINYGMGNIGSIQRKMNLLNVKNIIINDFSSLNKVDKLILPGVGHFGSAMEKIKKMNLIDPVNEIVLVKKMPILGICLGMQLMATYSEEGNDKGFGWFDANVLKFNPSDKYQHKIPHIGWNQIKFQKESTLSHQISDLDFYFVHSYYFQCHNKSDILATTNYEIEFASAVQKDNIFGCQFHPEKSHKQGETMLKNFINL